MKIAKKSNRNIISEGLDNMSDYVDKVDEDLVDLFKLTQGRIAFGSASSGNEGENISGEFKEFTSSSTPDEEFSVSHSMGATPIGYMIFYQDKAGSLYQGPSTGTSWDSETIYLKCDEASVTFMVFLIK